MNGANVQEAILKSEESLKRFAKSYTIFLDTCSLMHPRIKEFYFHIRRYLMEFGAKIHIPTRVIDELNKNYQVIERQKGVVDALTFLEVLRNDGLLKVVGNNDDEQFVDNLFLKEFTGLVMKKRVLFVTQDKRLASDVNNLNRRESVRNVNAICVGRINSYGYLSNFSERA